MRKTRVDSIDKHLLVKIEEIKWLSRWAGSYTFISCSYWGLQYFRDLKKELGLNFPHTLFIHRVGTVAFYLSEREYKKLGQTLAARSIKNYLYAKKYCKGMKENTDILLKPVARRSSLFRRVRTMAKIKLD